MRRLIRRIQYWLRLRRLEDSLAEEMEFHREMKRRELERDGVAAEEAAFAARRAMGNMTLSREDARAVWIWSSVEQLVQDARYGTRTLVKKPGFTLTAVAILALAIGLTTAMFTLVDALLLRPVPFRDPENLAWVAMFSERGGRQDVAPAVLRAWRESPAFDGVEAAVTDTALIEMGASVAARAVARVTPGMFDLLGGVRPVRGRLFDSSEGRAGNDAVVLLSEDVWRSLYGADPALLGRSITIDGEPVTVVGILPSNFRFPEWNTMVWRPIDFDTPPLSKRNVRPVAYARFATEVPRADALRMAREAARAADPANAELSPHVQPLAGMVLDPYYQRAVPLLGGGVVLVFLVLCANLSSLLLARLTTRRRQFSMCSALGASRVRLMRQAFLESTLLGALGVAAGIALAWMLVSVAREVLPEAFLIRTLNPLHIDLRALAVASASGLVATVGAGLLPAWIGTRVDAAQSLRVVDRGGTETSGARAITRGLLVVEIALACTLLVGATLLVRSFINLAGVERGLEARGVVTATISLPNSAFPDATARAAAARLIEEQIRALPRVQQVAWSYGGPPGGGAVHFGEWTSDVPEVAVVDMDVESYEVGPEFFALYGIPLLRGRAFQPSDTYGTVIVAERFARTLWPGIDPVGRSFRFGKEFHVIGLAREIHHPSLDPRLDRPEFYHPFAGGRSYAMMSIRCGDGCPDAALVRHRIVTSAPAARVFDVGPLENAYFEQLAQPRAAAALGFVFAVIAVLAAAGGLFSVLSYAVASRRREFGIRTALGASPAQIRRVVVRDGLRVAVAGVSIGAICAWVLARGLASLQYGVTPGDPLTWTFVLGLLGITTIAASWRPAREASRVDPVMLLREE